MTHLGSIRRATPDDAEAIAQAIIYAGGDFLKWLFGKKFKDIVYESALSENCSFSWVNAAVYDINGKIAGVVIYYPSDREKEMDRGMSHVLRKHFGFWSFFTFIRRATKAVKYFKKPQNSYYILAISVFPEFRGKGLASQLIGYVEKLAKNNGYKWIALEVENYNYSALRTYQKFGFYTKAEVPMAKFSKSFCKTKKDAMLTLLKKIE
jgi:ribosomal protein S18 acetylase RimI-like enzyme